MKKKFIFAVVIVVAICIFGACKKKEENGAAPSTEAGQTGTSGEEESSAAEIMPETVSLTVPPEYLDAVRTPEEWDEYAKQTDGIYSVQIEDNGSVTFKLTKEMNDKLLEEVTARINAAQ